MPHIVRDIAQASQRWGGGLVVVFVLVVGAAVLVDEMFGEQDSKPIGSDETVTSSDLYVNVLEDLSDRKHDSFATFEVEGNPGVWFQVNGSDLIQGNCPWPSSDAPVGVMLGQLGVTAPQDFKIVADDVYEGTRVVTFECAPLPPTEWANLIDAFFVRVHGLPEGYRVKGWVTRAD